MTWWQILLIVWGALNLLVMVLALLKYRRDKNE